MNRFKRGKPGKCVAHDGVMQAQFPAQRESFPFVYRIGGDDDEPLAARAVPPPPRLTNLGDYVARDIPDSERRLIARFARDRSGVAAVEAALVMPILITLLLGAFFYGIAMITANQLQFACESAALCAGYGQCQTSAAAALYAAGRMNGSPYNTVFTVNMNAACSGSSATGVQVAGTLNYQPFTMFPVLTLSASACAPTMPQQAQS